MRDEQIALRDTHAKEGHKTAALEVSRLWVRKLRPDLLEGSHLGPRYRLRAAGRLEHVGEVLDDHTGKHIYKNVLPRNDQTTCREEGYTTNHAKKIPSNK